MMVRWMLWFGLGLFCNAGYCSDTLELSFNKLAFEPGDTISFHAVYPDWQKKKHTGTLNLLMEDVHHRSMWRMRYPVLHGEALGEIIIPANFPAGIYICAFSLQDDFFTIRGKVMSSYKDSTVRLTMIMADQQIMAQDITLNKAKEFELRKLLFSDKATVYFKPSRKNRDNDLDIQLEVPLDSTFEPVLFAQQQIRIGNIPANYMPPAYHMDSSLMANSGGTLHSVTVIAQKKTAVDQYQAEFVSPRFRVSDALLFEGIESNQFIGFLNIMEWLRGRVAGLVIRPTGNGLSYTASWQGGNTAFFLDEMEVDGQTLATIAVSDIALVKVMRPPFYGAYLGGAGGAIAVYTKTGGSLDADGLRHNFRVNGYTPETFLLPVKSQQDPAKE